MKINDTELENLIKEINIEPSAQWQATALEKIKKTVTESNSFGINNSNLIFYQLFMNRRKVAVLGIVGLAVLTGVLATGLMLSRMTIQAPTKVFNQAEIFQKIVLNNPNLAQARNTNSAEGAAQLASTDKMAVSSMIAPLPFESEYNYYYSKTTIKRGPAFNTCNYGIDQSNIVFVPVMESFTYNSSTQSYSKFVGLNEDGSINNYNLSITTTTPELQKYENVIYFGGSYAVRMRSESVVDSYLREVMPSLLGEDGSVTNDNTQEETTVEDPIAIDYSSYFGPDAEVLRTEVINGREHYVIQYSYEVDCTGMLNLNRWQDDGSSKASLKRMYFLSYADVETYQVNRYETYIDSVSTSNLVDSSETVIQNGNVEFSSVASNFTFDYNVELRDINLDEINALPEYNADTEIQRALDYAKEENITVLMPTGDNVLNPYLYFNSYIKYQPVALNSQYSYYTDRAFYPSGSIGDKMYNSYSEVGSYFTDMPVSLGTASYTMGDASFSLDYYSKEYSNLDILNTLIWSEISNKSETQTTVRVNGEQVEATLYSFDAKDISIMPYTTEISTLPIGSDTCPNDDCIRRMYVLIFEFGNNKYTLKEYQYADLKSDLEYNYIEEGVFKSLSFDNADEFAELNTYLTNTIKGLSSEPQILPAL